MGAAAKDSLLEGSAHGQPNHLIFTIPNKFQPPSLTCGLVEHGPTIAALLFNNDIVFQLQFLLYIYISPLMEAIFTHTPTQMLLKVGWSIVSDPG